MKPLQEQHGTGRFNLSAIALKFPQITLFFLLATAVARTLTLLFERW